MTRVFDIVVCYRAIVLPHQRGHVQPITCLFPVLVICVCRDMHWGHISSQHLSSRKIYVIPQGCSISPLKIDLWLFYWQAGLYSSLLWYRAVDVTNTCLAGITSVSHYTRDASCQENVVIRKAHTRFPPYRVSRFTNIQMQYWFV